ncbi:MAG: HDIG domain-containing metalloprotein [Mycoplasma sp.]
MSNEIILIICLSIVLFICAFALIFCLFTIKKNKAKALNHKLKLKIDEYNKKNESLDSKILSLDTLDQESLKQEFFKIIEKQNKNKVKEMMDETNELIKEKSSIILLNAMEHLIEPMIQDNTSVAIKIEDEQIKGRIIGKNGRNKKIFETLTGVDLVIEKDTPYLTLSTHNPIRKEISRLVLTELLKSKIIEPAKIEVIYKDVSENFESSLFEEGRHVVEDIFKIIDLPSGIYPYVGRLKYRNSYGQNALQHSIECAQFANIIANELGLDKEMATKCALLHDIGKSNDYEINENHVESGKKITLSFNLNPFIINSVESHHGQTVVNNIYSAIAKLADTFSASRPGARIDSFNEYFERVQLLEKIVNEFDQVNQCYAIKSGRQLRVIVNPSKVLDNELETLALKIKEKLETNETISGFNIKVVIVKENRYEFETDSNRY